MEELEGLYLELRAPVRTIRIFAIEKAIRFGNTTELLDELIACIQFEDDSECKMLLEHAISQVKMKIGITKILENEFLIKPSLQINKEAIDNDKLEATLLKRLLKISSTEKTEATSIIEEALNSASSDTTTLGVALRAATYAHDERWVSTASKLLKQKDEQLQAAALEYLSVFDTDNFMLLTRQFAKSKSIVIHTAIQRGLFKNSPDIAREFIIIMLINKSFNIRERALGSLIHFEFSSVREELLSFLHNENDETLINSGIALYLANPMLDGIYDLKLLGETRQKSVFINASEKLKEIIIKSGIARHKEIEKFIETRALKDKESKEAETAKLIESKRVKKANSKSNQTAINETTSFLSNFYPMLKFIFIVGLIFVNIFFFLEGYVYDEHNNGDEARKFLKPIISKAENAIVTVLQYEASSGGILVIKDNNIRLLLLPRPGKKFQVIPGNKLSVEFMIFRQDPRGYYIARTLKVKNAPLG